MARNDLFVLGPGPSRLLFGNPDGTVHKSSMVIQFAHSLLPAIAGGIAVASILRSWSQSRAITPMTSIGVGALVGLFVGAAIAIIMFAGLPMPGGRQAAFELGAMGSLVGAWHGWRMAKWLNNPSAGSDA